MECRAPGCLPAIVPGHNLISTTATTSAAITRSMKKVLLIVIATLFLGSIATSHAESRPVAAGGGGRLVIWRSPSLGNDLVVGLLIDGRRAASITYGGHFETILAPGRHVIGVQAFPQPFPREPYNVVINVRPGELYNFTARGGTLQLELR